MGLQKAGQTPIKQVVQSYTRPSAFFTARVVGDQRSAARSVPTLGLGQDNEGVLNGLEGGGLSVLKVTRQTKQVSFPWSRSAVYLVQVAGRTQTQLSTSLFN